MATLSSNKIKILPPNVNVVIEGRTIVLMPITGNEVNEKYLSWLNDPELNQFLEIRYRRQTIADIYDYINGLRLSEGCEIFAIFLRKVTFMSGILPLHTIIRIIRGPLFMEL